MNNLTSCQDEFTRKCNEYERLKMDHAIMSEDLSEYTEMYQLLNDKVNIEKREIGTEINHDDHYDVLYKKYVTMNSELEQVNKQCVMLQSELKESQGENERLLESNHKQKLQYLVQLKRENNVLKSKVVMLENSQDFLKGELSKRDEKENLG